MLILSFGILLFKKRLGIGIDLLTLKVVRYSDFKVFFGMKWSKVAASFW